MEALQDVLRTSFLLDTASIRSATDEQIQSGSMPLRASRTRVSTGSRPSIARAATSRTRSEIRTRSQIVRSRSAVSSDANVCFPVPGQDSYFNNPSTLEAGPACTLATLHPTRSPSTSRQVDEIHEARRAA